MNQYDNTKKYSPEIKGYDSLLECIRRHAHFCFILSTSFSNFCFASFFDMLNLQTFEVCNIEEKATY